MPRMLTFEMTSRKRSRRSSGTTGMLLTTIMLSKLVFSFGKPAQ
jgi:hypothetical protein